jgi:hypothetical protein
MVLSAGILSPKATSVRSSSVEQLTLQERAAQTLRHAQRTTLNERPAEEREEDQISLMLSQSFSRVPNDHGRGCDTTCGPS